MESSSKIYGDRKEECQSSESGWTMYIGSSIDGGVMKKDEDTDDDSMASDASSGPSNLHLQQPCEVQQDESDKKKHDDDDDQENNKCALSKKNKKTTRKKKGHEFEESRKKDESLVNEKRGVVTTVQSGNRAWFLGKRK